jgi:hypothetical protein
MSPQLLNATPMESLSAVLPHETIINNPILLRKYYKEEISKHLDEFLTHTQAAFTSATEIARLLEAAHKDLSSEDYALLVDSLNISSHYKMMRLAYNPRLAALAEKHDLPEHWTVQYELIQMDAETFEHAEQLGCKSLTVAKAKKLRKDAEAAKSQNKSGSASNAGVKASTHNKPVESEPQTKSTPASPPPKSPTNKLIESEQPEDDEAAEGQLGDEATFLDLSLPALVVDTTTKQEIQLRLVVMLSQLVSEYPVLEGMTWLVTGDRWIRQ